MAIASLPALTVSGQDSYLHKKIGKKVSQIEADLKKQENQLLTTKGKNDSIEKVNKKRLDSIEVWQKITETKIELQNSEQNDCAEFLKDLVVEMAGAFLGGLVAIYIFLRQQKGEKIKEENKKKNEDKERVMYMKELSKSTVNVTRPWAEGLINVSDSIKANNEEIPLLKMFPTQDIGRLLKLFDNESYFHAFLSYFGSNDKNLKIFKSISHAADFINDQIRQAYETHHKALNFDHDRKVKFQSIFQKNISFCTELTPKTVNTDFNARIHAHVVSFSSKHPDPTSLKNIQNDYIDPLRNEILKSWTSLEYARLILSQLDELEKIKNDIESQNSQHSDDLNKFGNKLEEALKNIENQILGLGEIEAS